MLSSKEHAADLDALRELIETGAVTPAVDRTYPLADAAAAVRDVHDGLVRGKAVITI
jgi:NADPH:quinone reductase-like Zn-dependent oxidoreductase